MIRGHGPEASPLMIVGDYPTKEEQSRNEAWIGSSGNLINKLLKANDHSIEKCYRTLYIKDLTGDIQKAVGIKTKKERLRAIRGLKEQLLPFQHWLIEEIKSIQPRVILSSGELALQFLCDVTDITKYRGSVSIPSDRIQLECSELDRLVIVPILSPREMFQDPRAIYYTRFDISKAVHFLTNPYIPPFSKYNLWIVKTAAQFIDFKERHLRNNPRFMTTDLETYLGFITCASFCFDGREAVCVPLLDEDIDEGNKVLLYREIDELLRSGIPIINQNLKYDWHSYEKWGFILKNPWDDTMLRSHTLYCEMPRDLGFLNSIYTDIPYYKDENVGFNPKKENKIVLYLYNAKDALSAWIIADEQEKELKEVEIWPGYTQWDFHQSRVVPLFKSYKRIDDRGILVDTAQRETLKIKYQAQLEVRQKLIDDVAGEHINVDSVGANGQAGKFIYYILGFPLRWHYNDDGVKIPDTDEETIEDIALNYSQSEGVKVLLYNFLACRKIKRFLKFLNLPLHSDGRLRTQYKLQGTVTGRTSTSECDDFFWNEKGKQEKYGTAFQKMPKHPEELPDGTKLGDDLRSIFIPRDGYCLVEADSKGAEARVVAVLAENYEMLENMDRIHYITASWVYGCDEKSIKKGSHEYDIGKRARHAGHYDMEAHRLSIMAHIPKREAELILFRFHQKDHRIREIFHKAIRDLLDPRLGGKQRLVTPFGRVRDFFGRIDDKTIKEGYAHIPQSTISDNTKFALLRIEEQLSWAEIIVEWHDSLVAEIPINRLEEYCVCVDKEMSQPIDFNRGSVKRNFQLSVPTEIQVGFENWHKMEEVKL